MRCVLRQPAKDCAGDVLGKIYRETLYAINVVVSDAHEPMWYSEVAFNHSCQDSDMVICESITAIVARRVFPKEG